MFSIEVCQHHFCAWEKILRKNNQSIRYRKYSKSRVISANSKGLQSTLLVWGETYRIAYRQSYGVISIHSPHVRRDGSQDEQHTQDTSFQSTLLMWGETCVLVPCVRISVISIHSPHVRRDLTTHCRGSKVTNFNPLSSCEERLLLTINVVILILFQSTLLMWGETKYIRCCLIFMLFQSTLLMWGETSSGIVHPSQTLISIHSPHVRRDVFSPDGKLVHLDFNPLSSCEERPTGLVIVRSLTLFQSTLLMWGETASKPDDVAFISISIHSPHVRRDGILPLPWPGHSISIHSPHVRRDGKEDGSQEYQWDFNPLSSCEESDVSI